MQIKFIADSNAGKLARWLRMIGYDTLLFTEKDDSKLIKIALKESRVILTKDTQIIKRRLITNGKLKAIFIKHDDPKAQLQQTVKTLKLDYHFKPFSLCLECNQALIPRSKDEVQSLVPSYVFKTQKQYMECPSCHRIYWQGTHWQAMVKELENLANGR
ncbi:MAG: Mut7-C RNAse domain-containing protein [Dehalococcoidia bacterium]|nr:Mut7-C RNAse domain-containing protein [Dehalococcoidia bacterium]